MEGILDFDLSNFNDREFEDQMNLIQWDGLLNEKKQATKE